MSYYSYFNDKKTKIKMVKIDCERTFTKPINLKESQTNL